MSLDEINRRLDHIAEVCKESDYDSDGARPIRAEAIGNARAVAEAVAAWANSKGASSIGPLADGNAIEFTADTADGRTVILDVFVDGRIIGLIVESRAIESRSRSLDGSDGCTDEVRIADI